MADRLSQLQEAVNQLAHQFVACMHFVHRKHDLEVLGPTDKIIELKKDQPKEVDSLPAEEFRAGLLELSRDLVLREQHIEVLISSLPGLENSINDQERTVGELEGEIRTAEAQCQEAVREREQILARLNEAIKSIRRP